MVLGKSDKAFKVFGDMIFDCSVISFFIIGASFKFMQNGKLQMESQEKDRSLPSERN